MKTALLAVALVALLAASSAGLWLAWTRVGVEIPAIGWVWIAVGATLSIALGVGLMALSFFSARRGYDDAAHQGDERDGA